MTKISMIILAELIEWSNSVHFFKEINHSNQSDLLMNAWPELFVISLAKSDFILKAFLDALEASESINIESGQTTCKNEDLIDTKKHVIKNYESFELFQSVIDQIRSLHLNDEEYDFLRALILFNTGKF